MPFQSRQYSVSHAAVPSPLDTAKVQLDYIIDVAAEIEMLDQSWTDFCCSDRARVSDLAAYRRIRARLQEMRRTVRARLTVPGIAATAAQYTDSETGS